MANKVAEGQQSFLQWDKTNIAVAVGGALITAIFLATAGVGGASLYQHLHQAAGAASQGLTVIPQGVAIGMTAGGGALAGVTIFTAAGIIAIRSATTGYCDWVWPDDHRENRLTGDQNNGKKGEGGKLHAERNENKGPEGNEADKSANDSRRIVVKDPYMALAENLNAGELKIYHRRNSDSDEKASDAFIVRKDREGNIYITKKIEINKLMQELYKPEYSAHTGEHHIEKIVMPDDQ